MYIITRLSTVNWNKIIFISLAIIIALLASRFVSSESYEYLLLFLFSGAVLFLYLTQFEFFILFMLIINQELFFLLPRELLGRATFQDLLYIVLLITGGWYFLRKKNDSETNSNLMIISFLGIVIVGIFNSYFQGQPIILGLKAAKGYYLILFYFVFMSKDINIEKLFRMIVIAGVLLALANNMQYVFFGDLKIFHFSEALERAGQLRFLMGDFFTIFSPIIALSEYLKAKKKIYLIAFLYMLVTVVVQGKTRAVIWGFLVTILIMLYLSKKINFIKMVLIGVPLFSIIIWISPAIRLSFISELYELTEYEFTEKTGNVGIRFDAYDYYLGEIRKSPVIGRGIWNYQFRENNPEDKGLQLSDIGIINFVFHFGLIGVIWLLVLLARIYKVAFLSIGQLKRAVPCALVGYFIFSFFTMPTLNCLLDRRTIIYLVLVLALFSQVDLSHEKNSQV